MRHQDAGVCDDALGEKVLSFSPASRREPELVDRSSQLSALLAEYHFEIVNRSHSPPSHNRTICRCSSLLEREAGVNEESFS